MSLMKYNTNFRLEQPFRKIRTTFSADIPLLPEIFRWIDPKSRVPFTVPTGFPETFNGKRSIFLSVMDTFTCRPLASTSEDLILYGYFVFGSEILRTFPRLYHWNGVPPSSSLQLSFISSHSGTGLLVDYFIQEFHF